MKETLAWFKKNEYLCSKFERGRVTKEVRKILIQKMYGKIKHSNGDQSSSEQER